VQQIQKSKPKVPYFSQKDSRKTLFRALLGIHDSRPYPGKLWKSHYLYLFGPRALIFNIFLGSRQRLVDGIQLSQGALLIFRTRSMAGFDLSIARSRRA